ncbi:hypothetical protein M0802_011350 [Mischocyttarus mexicanus]|nr:hypothetical protein M0802_011350 [Mischocyttarus mexicanus]
MQPNQISQKVKNTYSPPSNYEPNKFNSRMNAPPAGVLKIVNFRDCIKNRKDNLVIFISYQGKSLDKGALELHENKMLPEYIDIMAKRAKVADLTRSKNLISLPIDYPPHKSDIINVLRSLFDVVTEKKIESFSIDKSSFMGDIPWRSIEKYLKEIFANTKLAIIVCSSLVQTPSRDSIEEIIIEKVVTQNLQVGDDVFLQAVKQGKFGNTYNCPYKILELTDNNNATIDLGNKKTRKVYVDRLKLYRK